MYDIPSLVAVQRKANQLLLDQTYNMRLFESGIVVALSSDVYWRSLLSSEQWTAYAEAMRKAAEEEEPAEPEDGSLDPLTVGTAIFQSNDAMFRIPDMAGLVFGRYGARMAQWAESKAPGWAEVYNQKIGDLKAQVGAIVGGPTLEIGGDVAGPQPASDAALHAGRSGGRSGEANIPGEAPKEPKEGEEPASR